MRYDLGDISKISVTKEKILITFQNGSKCELSRHTSQCSGRFYCRPVDCFLPVETAAKVGNILEKEFAGISQITLIPDWISKITKNGKGWRVT